MKTKGATIPAPQNLKRRETFLLNNPSYYKPARFEHELLLIAKIRSEKSLKWKNRITEVLEQKPVQSELKVTPKKQTIADRFKQIFRPKGNKASQRGA